MAATITAQQLRLAFGVAGIIAGIILMATTRRAITNFQQHRKIAIAMTFPHSTVQRGLGVLLASSIFVTAGMLAAALGTYTSIQTHILNLVSRVFSVIGVAGLLFFTKSIADATEVSEYRKLIETIAQYSDESMEALEREAAEQEAA